MKTYRIYSTGHNGGGDCRPITIKANTLTGAQRQATAEAAGDRCYMTIQDNNGNTLAMREAKDTFRGCCMGWLPWTY